MTGAPDLHLLEAQASLLSVAPAFDGRIAADLLDRSKDWLSSFDDRVADPIVALRLAGLIVEWKGVMRIADPLRTDLARKLSVDHPQQYKASARRFTEHARNGFSDKLQTALGRRGAEISVAVLGVTAADTETESDGIDRLISTLQQPSSQHVDTATAIRQLEQSAVPGLSIERTKLFLLGLYDWRKGDRKLAAERFEQILARPRGDHIEGISGHLLGVFRAEQGDLKSSLLLLHSSSELLRKLDDRRGLAQTLTSYGRILRASALSQAMSSDRAEVAEEQLFSALSILDEAVSIGDDIGSGAIEGLALLELSRVEQASESLELAIESAEEAAAILAGGQGSHLLHVHVHLGSLYRDSGRSDDARGALRKAAEIARDIGAADLTLARILNVQASADRRAGLLDEAIESARESVAVGERLRDRKHTAHALHTLAAALLDLGVQDATEEAIGYLNRSLDLLRTLGDSKGIDMVERTLRRTDAQA
ncbi:MAG: tetratricopeptide repeat protein [Mycobacterium sp.]